MTLGAYIRNGQGVQIDYAEDIFELVLVLDPLINGADVITDMQLAGRLNTKEHALLWLVCHPPNLHIEGRGDGNWNTFDH